MADRAEFLQEARRLLGPRGLLEDAAARRVYARDSSHLALGRPLAVALPATAAELAQTVALCARHSIPVVARGSGTGLAGGALPPTGALVLGTSRLDDLGAVDPGRRVVRVGAGVLNERVSRHASSHQLHFAPDPSSQNVATIGGNVAANAGGPHCLVHGVTLNHLRNLHWVDARGRRHESGRGLSAERGFHLASLLCGSEGTLGLVTAADLNLVSNPATAITLLAFFPSLADATRTVVTLLGRGLLPVAVEMVDQAMLQAVEAAFAFGFATDVEAALIIEFAGRQQAVTDDSACAQTLLTDGGAREVRVATDASERQELWACRKQAFGAVGRLAPHYVTMDVVVPLGELPALVQDIQDIKARHRVHVATVFHAGDGNLHPGVHYDDRDPDETARAHQAADQIIRCALARGGSCTGEHGVGLEKRHALPWQIDRETANLFHGLKAVCDPAGLLNPGKLLPDPQAEYAPPHPAPVAIRVAAENLWLTAPGEASVDDLQDRAAAAGLWLPVGMPLFHPRTTGALTVTQLIDHALTGPALLTADSPRNLLLELWGRTGDGRRFRAGEAVFKNVAGYSLAPALCGSGGALCRVTGATFQLRPRPSAVRVISGTWSPETAHRLEALFDALVQYGLPQAAPTVLVDTQAGRLTLLVPGRDTAWDLGAISARVAGLWPDLAQTSSLVLPCEQALDLELPPWLTAAQTWTALAALPAVTDPVLPTGRFVWQAAPRLVWVAGAPAESPGWFADTVVRDGDFTACPAPAAGVPRAILRGIKALFDPDQSLPVPDWLAGGDHD